MSPDSGFLGDAERAALAAIARAAVSAAVRDRPYEPPALAGRLADPGAAFVTLRHAGELRGCIGSIEARRALGVDVAENARAAALRDLRFAPIAADELDELEIELSILTLPVPIPVASREELLAALVPGLDGLVLEEGERRATFLPSVWEQLREPEEFVRQLERKAGFAPGSWSRARRAFRYRVESVAAGAAR